MKTNTQAFATGLAVVLVLAGCGGPRIDVQSASKMPLASVKSGTCFVGCSLDVRLADGTDCGGFSGGPTAFGKAFSGFVYCPDNVKRVLEFEATQKGAPAIGAILSDEAFQRRATAHQQELKDRLTVQQEVFHAR